MFSSAEITSWEFLLKKLRGISFKLAGVTSIVPTTGFMSGSKVGSSYDTFSVPETWFWVYSSGSSWYHMGCINLLWGTSKEAWIEIHWLSNFA
ncbi:hypothetical protein JHK87_009940 [Glycine soja]|nr:hypothetical protein JHK87_009940 [Glycine soja]